MISDFFLNHFTDRAFAFLSLTRLIGCGVRKTGVSVPDCGGDADVLSTIPDEILLEKKNRKYLKYQKLLITQWRC